MAFKTISLATEDGLCLKTDCKIFVWLDCVFSADQQLRFWHISVSEEMNLTSQNCTKHPRVSKSIKVTLFLAWALIEDLYGHSLNTQEVDSPQDLGQSLNTSYLKLQITLLLAIQCTSFKVLVGQSLFGQWSFVQNLSVSQLFCFHFPQPLPILLHLLLSHNW